MRKWVPPKARNSAKTEGLARINLEAHQRDRPGHGKRRMKFMLSWRTSEQAPELSLAKDGLPREAKLIPVP